MFDERSLYSLEENGSNRLEISWGFFRPFVIVYLDGQEIGRIKRSKLSYPQTFTLNNGRELTIQERQSFRLLGIGFYPYLHITYDGKELPDLKVTGEQHVQQAIFWLFLMAILKLALAIFKPIKSFAFPPLDSFRNFLEWRIGFTGLVVIGLIFFALYLLPKRYIQPVLLAGLILMVGELTFEISCVFLCDRYQLSYLMTIQALAAFSFYQAFLFSRSNA